MTPEETKSALANLRVEVPSILPKFAAVPKITPLSHFLSGEAAFEALKREVDILVHLAPADHDVLIHAFGIAVRQVRFVEPHTLLFRGVNDEGHDTSVIAHFTQLVARIVYLPTQGPRRIVTGFATMSDANTDDAA